MNLNHKKSKVYIELLQMYPWWQEEIYKQGHESTLEQYKKVYQVLISKFENPKERIGFLLDLIKNENDITLRGRLAHLLEYSSFHDNENCLETRSLVNERLNELYQKEEIPFIKRSLSLVYFFYNNEKKALELLQQQVEEYGEKTEAGHSAKIILLELEKTGKIPFPYIGITLWKKYSRNLFST